MKGLKNIKFYKNIERDFLSILYKPSLNKFSTIKEATSFIQTY